jgi:hypothetical protein
MIEIYVIVCSFLILGKLRFSNELMTNTKLYKEGDVMDIVDFRLETLSENELLEALRVIFTTMLSLQHLEDVRPLMALWFPCSREI